MSESIIEKRYLGDAVYCEDDGFHVILTVPGYGHQSGQDQRIALEPGVLRSLLRYKEDFDARAHEIMSGHAARSEQLKQEQLHSFFPGQKVRYIPGVANGDHTHEACEDGIVRSVTRHYVFVFYGYTGWDGKEDDLRYIAKATDPADLISMEPVEETPK